MCVNSYEYACLIDQFWFEYGLHVSSSRIQIFESLFCSLLSRPSLSHACSFRQLSLSFLQLTRTLTSCFSYPRKHGLSTSPLRSVTLSLSLYITRFSLSLTSLLFSGITLYLSFLFTATHTVSTRLSLVFLFMGFSHTPYMSLHMTHTTKITLSISPVDTTFVVVSFLSPSQTNIIHLFTDQTTPTTVSSLSLSQTHTHNSYH